MTHQIISAAEFARQAASQSFLYQSLWSTGTVMLIHSPAGLSTSTALASVLAEAVPRSGSGLLINTATTPSGASLFASIRGLSVLTPGYDGTGGPTDYADLIIDAIGQIIDRTGIRLFAIDSLSRMAALSFRRNASQPYLLKRLAALAMQRRVSIVVATSLPPSSKAALRSLLAIAPSNLPVTQPSDFTVKQSTNLPVTDSSATATPATDPNDLKDPNDPNDPNDPKDPKDLNDPKAPKDPKDPKDPNAPCSPTPHAAPNVTPHVTRRKDLSRRDRRLLRRTSRSRSS